MFYSAVTYVLEVAVPISNPLTNQPFLELVYAMLLTSIGSAMIFNGDASSGGTDIAAQLCFTSYCTGSRYKNNTRMVRSFFNCNNRKYLWTSAIQTENFNGNSA